jgi:hypothetical protein
LQVSTITKPEEQRRAVVTAAPFNARVVAQSKSEETKEEPEAEFLSKIRIY